MHERAEQPDSGGRSVVRKSSNRVFGAMGRRPGVRCDSVACAIHCLARLGPGKTQSPRVGDL